MELRSASFHRFGSSTFFGIEVILSRFTPQKFPRLGYLQPLFVRFICFYHIFTCLVARAKHSATGVALVVLHITYFSLDV